MASSLNLKGTLFLRPKGWMWSLVLKIDIKGLDFFATSSSLVGEMAGDFFVLDKDCSDKALKGEQSRTDGGALASVKFYLSLNL